MTSAMRLEASLEPLTESGCYVFTGWTRDGYGRIIVNGKRISTHRLAWELANGPIPKGLCVCHKCDTRRCCRIDHLFLGSPADNSFDKCSKNRQARGRTHTIAVAKVLNEDTALAVFKASGPQKEIAARFGINNRMVSKIKRKQSWKFIHAKAPGVQP